METSPSQNSSPHVEEVAGLTLMDITFESTHDPVSTETCVSTGDNAENPTTERECQQKPKKKRKKQKKANYFVSIQLNDFKVDCFISMITSHRCS